MSKKHVHDCTGPDAKCPCGYVFSVPPISLSVEVFDGRREVLNEVFYCHKKAVVIDALRRYADRLEREP